MPKKTQGKVGQLFKQAKENITYYLKTGESKGFSGHTLMWEVQKDFIDMKLILENL